MTTDPEPIVVVIGQTFDHAKNIARHVAKEEGLAKLPQLGSMNGGLPALYGCRNPRIIVAGDTTQLGFHELDQWLTWSVIAECRDPIWETWR